MNNLLHSVKRACTLFDAGSEDHEYISIKIRPINGGCCCFHCWPKTWEVVTQSVHTKEPLEDEGDALIIDGNNEYVIECHESGPEIVILIDRIVAYSSFLVSVAGLIFTIIQARQKEKPGTKLELIKRTYKKGIIKEEIVMRIDGSINNQNEIVSILTEQIDNK